MKILKTTRKAHQGEGGEMKQVERNRYDIVTTFNPLERLKVNHKNDLKAIEAKMKALNWEVKDMRIVKVAKELIEIDKDIQGHLESGMIYEWIEGMVDLEGATRRMRNLDLVYRSYYSTEYIEFYYGGKAFKNTKFTLRAYTPKGIDLDMDTDLQTISSFIYFFKDNGLELNCLENYITTKYSDFIIDIDDYTKG